MYSTMVSVQKSIGEMQNACIHHHFLHLRMPFLVFFAATLLAFVCFFIYTFRLPPQGELRSPIIRDD